MDYVCLYLTMLASKNTFILLLEFLSQAFCKLKLFKEKRSVEQEEWTHCYRDMSIKQLQDSDHRKKFTSMSSIVIQKVKTTVFSKKVPLQPAAFNPK